MTKRRKLVLRLSGGPLMAMRGNSGYFHECAGLDRDLLKGRHECTCHLTEKGFRQVYAIVNEVIAGVRYPNKSGPEYQAMLEVRQILEAEFLRQTNQSLD